jgi:hypothetical protein
MDYKYQDYFPLASKNDNKGAYDFLASLGYGEEVDCIKREGYNPSTRRLMVVGLIYDKNLLDRFLGSIWTQGILNHRKDRMGILNRRYRKRRKLHICW